MGNIFFLILFLILLFELSSTKAATVNKCNNIRFDNKIYDKHVRAYYVAKMSIHHQQNVIALLNKRLRESEGVLALLRNTKDDNVQSLQKRILSVLKHPAINNDLPAIELVMYDQLVERAFLESSSFRAFCLGEILKNAAKVNNTELVDFVIIYANKKKAKIYPPSIQQALECAVRRDYVFVVNRLIDAPLTNSDLSYCGLLSACALARQCGCDDTEVRLGAELDQRMSCIIL